MAVPVGELTCVSFHPPCNVVVRNTLVLVLEGELTCVSFLSLSNVVVTNALMLVLERNITCVIFSTWCNEFDGNVVVPVGNITHVSLHSYVMLLLEITLWLC